MEYLSKYNLKQPKADFSQIISNIRKELKLKGITFETPKLVGSAKRNLVLLGNEGYDLDFQLKLSKYPSAFSAKEIKLAFMRAFNGTATEFGLETCEDSTHVITIKKLEDGHIVYSYDVAILEKNAINKYIILKNEKNDLQNDDANYHFVELSDAVNLDVKYAGIKGADEWQTLREKYKEKKAKQQNLAKDKRIHSISLLAVAVKETLV